MLTSDDAKHICFNSRSVGYFLEEEIKSNDCSTWKRVSNAIAKFGETAAKYSEVRLAAFALSAQLSSKGHFDDIVESIDKMVTNLKAEYKEDL